MDRVMSLDLYCIPAKFAAFPIKFILLFCGHVRSGVPPHQGDRYTPQPDPRQLPQRRSPRQLRPRQRHWHSANDAATALQWLAWKRPRRLPGPHSGTPACCDSTDEGRVCLKGVYWCLGVRRGVRRWKSFSCWRAGGAVGM